MATQNRKKSSKNEADDEVEARDLAAWEEDYTLDVKDIKEDAFGAITWKNLKKEEEKRKQRLSSTQTELRVEKGMIRYIYIILDCSQSMNKKDLKPNRMVVSQQMIEKFISEFFDQNPLSQLGLIIGHHKIAQKLTDLGGNPLQQMEKLHNITDHLLLYEQDNASTSTSTNEEPANNSNNNNNNCLSLQNCLLVAQSSLSQIPIHGSREIILITSALSSIDPSDIFATIKSLKQHKIRCNIISLSAELHILSLIAKMTAGTFNVAMNESHFHNLLLQQVPPQPICHEHYAIGRKWIKMGFPQHKINNYPSLCFCHDKQFSYQGYYCPQCHSKQCELPTDCTVCGLALISSPHLVRSYHYVFPVPQFQEITTINAMPTNQRICTCFACQSKLDHTKNLVETCQKCKNTFCIECNVFIHESLHNCPGCMSRASD